MVNIQIARGDFRSYIKKCTPKDGELFFDTNLKALLVFYNGVSYKLPSVPLDNDGNEILGDKDVQNKSETLQVAGTYFGK